MKILWLVNIPLPEASRLLGTELLELGGWLVGYANALLSEDNIELHVMFPFNRSAPEYLKGERIHYYPFQPFKLREKSRINNDKHFREILIKVKPDLVHIHGTEFPHTLAMVNACNELSIKYVISIQGLVSFIEKHMYSNLPCRVIYGKTLRNILMHDSVSSMRKQFQRRGLFEIEALQRSKYVVGRTSWDEVCVKQINPSITYFKCNEILRDEFYKHKWDITKCEQYSIFVSQGGYSIKGLHNVIEALPIILKEFPQTKVYLAGSNVIRENASSIKEKISITYYGKYIKRLIKQLNLQGKVIYVGRLNEIQMIDRMLKSNVFVLPSAIENSPNSLAEAMILGVPTVASYVGGVPDMIKHDE